MASGSKISDVMLELWRQHHIGEMNRVTHHVLFPAYKFGALEFSDTLCEVGVQDLSVLHVRISILGGAPRSGGAGTSTNTSSSAASSSSGIIERITNSPLVGILPWSVDGLNNDEWRSWVNDMPEDLKIPTWINFSGLLREIADTTNDHLSSATATQSSTRQFFGFDQPTGKKPNLPDHCILGLQVINFMAERMGMGRTTKTYPRYRNPELGGKNESVLNSLGNWQDTLKKFLDLTREHMPVSVTPDHSSSEEEDDEKQLQALLRNLWRPYQADHLQTIIHNFSLAAFMLGWYFQGHFKLPDKVDGLFNHLRGHESLTAQVDADRAEIKKNVKSVKDLLKPFKMALETTPILLLVPRQLHASSYNDAQLIKFFQSLGTFRPSDIATCEKAIMDEVWMLARGVKRAETAMTDLAANLKLIELNATTGMWFQGKSMSDLSTSVTNSGANQIMSEPLDPLNDHDLFDQYTTDPGTADPPPPPKNAKYPSSAGSRRSTRDGEGLIHDGAGGLGIAQAFNYLADRNEDVGQVAPQIFSSRSISTTDTAGINPALITMTSKTPPARLDRDDRDVYMRQATASVKSTGREILPSFHHPPSVPVQGGDRPQVEDQVVLGKRSHKEIHYQDLSSDSPNTDDFLSPSQTTAKRVPAKKRRKAKTKRILDANTNSDTDSNADTDVGLSKPAAKFKSDSKRMAKMSTQLDVEMDTVQSVSESESDTDLDPENLQAVDDENIESEDSDGDIPLIDLTGDDELRAPNVKNKNTPVQGIRRDTKGIVIYCHSPFSQKVPEFTFRAWLKWVEGTSLPLVFTG
ncbi:hypothetical protein DFH09DRAFT_1117384 [Mycena vulgaris]|nr:hypothetical protein DFH09DRAFT_1117384 [Mycena vulgaris]